MNTYKRVSCHFYDELESAAVRKIICTIIYDNGNEDVEIRQKIVDLKIINKAEYMILDNDQKIRLDKIVLFNDINPNDNMYC